MVLIADLHTHTCVSHDSMTPIDILLKTAVRRGINVLAVTDHDTAKGGLTALRIAKLRGLRLTKLSVAFEKICFVSLSTSV